MGTLSPVMFSSASLFILWEMSRTRRGNFLRMLFISTWRTFIMERWRLTMSLEMVRETVVKSRIREVLRPAWRKAN